VLGYYIELGNMSGHSFKGSLDEAWGRLVAAVAELRESSMAIVDEVRRLNPDAKASALTPHAVAYSSLNKTAELRIIDEPEGDERKRQIVQYAGGDRPTKELVRRAFCRLLIDAMHREGIEVEMTVA
jgi:hypothetical protein